MIPKLVPPIMPRWIYPSIANDEDVEGPKLAGHVSWAAALPVITMKLRTQLGSADWKYSGVPDPAAAEAVRANGKDPDPIIMDPDGSCNPKYVPHGDSPRACQWLSCWGIFGATLPESEAITRSDAVPGVPGASVAVTPTSAPQICPAGWIVTRPVAAPMATMDVSLTVHVAKDVTSAVDESLYVPVAVTCVMFWVIHHTMYNTPGLGERAIETRVAPEESDPEPVPENVSVRLIDQGPVMIQVRVMPTVPPAVLIWALSPSFAFVWNQPCWLNGST